MAIPWRLELKYYFASNHQGDVMAIVDSTGTTIVSYTYDAWGNILSVTGTMADTLGESNPLRYRGYVYDQETGLYYVSSRYYDSEIGRFINADVLVSTGQGILGNNMFAYCRNNPVCRKDISGTTDVDIFDNELDPTDDDNEFGGGHTGGNGNSSSIPQYAYDTLDHVKSHNGSPPQGYKGGGTFANDGRNGSARLPDSYSPYREYDVYPKFIGQTRGPERIVIGNGVAYYTPNHYESFVLME